MIHLVKGPEPQILATNGAAWLKVLEDKIAAGQVPTDAEKSRYRKAEIKAALVAETHGKCAYCESYLLHIAFGDVEHISPKSLKLSDSFRWDNLTLACDRCNTYKKDAVGIVDPYIEDPDEFFIFLGPMIFARPEIAKAIITVRQLRLNRSELIESRFKRLDAISNLILIIQRTNDPAIREVLIQDLFENEIGDQAEFAAFARSFVKAIEPGLAVAA